MPVVHLVGPDRLHFCANVLDQNCLLKIVMMKLLMMVMMMMGGGSLHWTRTARRSV